MIWNLWKLKGYGARRLIWEFSDKNWKRREIKNCQERCTKVVYLILQEMADHTHPTAVWCSLEHWWYSWPMASTLASLYLSQRRTFEHYFVTISLFSLYLMNFTFHIMLDASGVVLKVHYKSMKCDVLFSQGSVRTVFRWGGHCFHTWVKHFFLFTTVQKL